MKQHWDVWAFGKTVESMSNAEIRMHAQRAWNSNDGDVLRAMRAEAAKRNLQVA